MIMPSLKKEHDFSSAIIDLAPSLILVVDRDGRIVKFNHACERATGYRFEEVEGQIFWELFLGPEEAERINLKFRQLQLSDSPFEYENSWLTKHGSFRLISWSATFLADEKGDIEYIIGTGLDITDSQQAKQELQKQEDFTASLIEHSAVATLVINTDHKVIFWNKALEKLTGISADEMLGTDQHWKAFYPFKRPTLADIIIDGNYEELPKLYSNYNLSPVLVTDGIHAERWLRGQDGKNRYLVFDASPVYNRQGQLIGAVKTLQDFTDHQHMADALFQSEAKNRVILNAIPDVMLQVQRNGKILSYKPAKNSYNYLEPPIKAVWLSQLFPSEVVEPMQAAINAVLEKGGMRILEYQLPVRGKLHDYEARLVISGEDEVLIIIRDVTQQKEVERLKNEFVSTVSHELRTPLTSIRGALGLLSNGVTGQLPPPALQLAEIAHKNSERLIWLINDILDIEKIENGKMFFDLKPHALMPLVHQAIEANWAYAAQFEVQFKLIASLPGVMVNVDNSRLTQVLTNLLSNAAKFSPSRDYVSVSVSRQANFIRIAVADNGPGIPEDFRERIFQKFAQADGSDSRQKGGTGLGLSISKAIMEKLAGKIGFEADPATGTIFYIDLLEWKS